MKPALLTPPPPLARRLDPGLAARLVGVGKAALLAEPLLGFIASRACPANVPIETLDFVPRWVAADCALISGFHSPLERQVPKSLLRRQGICQSDTVRTTKIPRFNTRPCARSRRSPEALRKAR
jgi:hypothetical protein